MVVSKIFGTFNPTKLGPSDPSWLYNMFERGWNQQLAVKDVISLSYVVWMTEDLPSFTCKEVVRQDAKASNRGEDEWYESCMMKNLDTIIKSWTIAVSIKIEWRWINFKQNTNGLLEPPCQAERKAAERTPPDLTSMMSSTGLEAQLISMSTVNW